MLKTSQSVFFPNTHFNEVTAHPMKSNRKLELLAPGGDAHAIKAAIAAGADAIYCGLNKFNARDRATNIEFDDLHGMIRLAHSHQCAVFLTLNIIVVENEIPALIKLLNRLVNTHIDAVIVQDLGLFYILKRHFKQLNIHASTQLNTHNEGQIHFLRRLGATRTNLSRELNIQEIKALTDVAHDQKMEIEVFVHGSYCLSFSGLCYISSVIGGRSGNRGRCSQPCRDAYEKTPKGVTFPLNLKDNSAFHDLRALDEAGVDSLKIEGRIKKFDYVYTVVNCWKKQIQLFKRENRLSTDNSALHKVFNRDFSNGFLSGNLHREMFTDNPRDHAIKQISDPKNHSSIEEMERARTQFYEEKEALSALAREKTAPLNIDRLPLTIHLSGAIDTPLKVSIAAVDTSFVLHSRTHLTQGGKKHAGNRPSCVPFLEDFKGLKHTPYTLDKVNWDGLPADLSLPFKELTWIKKQILSHLNGGKEILPPVTVSPIKPLAAMTESPRLSVLIDSHGAINSLATCSADLFFQLPSCFGDETEGLIKLFKSHETLVPWFPPVLIGRDYTEAVHLLKAIQPRRIVTNNTGIAHEAFKQGIPWVAGPYLNLVNSFSLRCLKDDFQCSGAFLSNEINRNQLKNIRTPEGFQLYYSMYHPISLLTSRQCLHHQVIGCEKAQMDKTCLPSCEKAASITHPKGNRLFIHKSRGNYHGIHHTHHFLNTDIVGDLPGRFSHFLIDLREIQTETCLTTDTAELVTLFEALLKGDTQAAEALHRSIAPTTHVQYSKGI